MDSPPNIVHSWQVHPARQRWRTALLTAGAIVIAACLVAVIMEQAAWGVFAVAVIVAGCNRFFFPTTYELDAKGITARFPLKSSRYQWAELRRFIYDDAGGFLSPRAKRSFLDEYRGISLLFADDGESVVEEICRRLPAEAIVRKVPASMPLQQQERTSCGG